MAKHSSKQDLESLKRRIAKLRADGLYEEAVRLARNLAREHPTLGHADLLRDVLLQRGALFFAKGQYAEAAAVYSEAARMPDGPPEYYSVVAAKLAACGDLPQALALLPRVADPEKMRDRLVAVHADFAIQQGAAGRAKLPEELHATFDAVLHAFRHAEAGRDDDARAALQTVGLQSPFLDWKMLLRGMLAYYARDDARAVENWKRLDRMRLPYQLAAPFWLAIDPAFQASLPPNVQKTFHARAQQLAGGKALKLLQEVRSSIGKESLASAFRAADKLVPALKLEAPQLVPRVADCFRWLIIDHGHPDDLDRFLRVFGSPTDDPALHLLQALALESRGLMHDAHNAWQGFLDDLTKHQPNICPKEHLHRVQALVYQRMGDNASSQATGSAKPKHRLLDQYLGKDAKSFKPSAVECYKKSIKLAPDLLDVRLALFDLHREKLDYAKAKKVALDLLKQFPDHGQTLEALGDLHRAESDIAQAVEHYTRALNANPLERRLRGKLARARRSFALELTLKGKFDDARKQLDLALTNWDGSRCPLLCQGAVIEMKAGFDAAEDELFAETPVQPSNRKHELLAQARAEPNQRLACAFTVAAEAVRAKLPKPTEKRLADTLKAELAQPATPEEILVLLEAAALQRESHATTFKGQQALERSFGKLLDKIDTAGFSEAQLERLCRHLGTLNLRTIWKKALAAAGKRFPSNPNIALSLLDCELAAPGRSRAMWFVKDQLEKVRKLAKAMPRGEVQGQLLDEIKRREEQIEKIEAARGPNPFHLFGRFFDPFGDDDEGDL